LKEHDLSFKKKENSFLLYILVLILALSLYRFFYAWAFSQSLYRDAVFSHFFFPEYLDLGGGPYEYPMKNCRRAAKFFPTWGLNQRY